MMLAVPSVAKSSPPPELLKAQRYPLGEGFASTGHVILTRSFLDTARERLDVRQTGASTNDFVLLKLSN